MTGHQDLENRPDAELVACIVRPAVAGQQQAAFEVIYQRYAWEVLALCGGIIWDDFDTARTVAQDALVVAYQDLSSGRPPAQPEKLRAWLLGIAKNRCREEFRRRNKTGLMPDELPDDDWETASRRRQAEVDRILSSVAATFTGPQQRIYELSIRQGLRGQALATALPTTEKNANDDTYENITRLEEGFGAYILAREGRPFCAVLAGILEFSAWDGQTFTRVLRLRILKHLDTCPTCGNCGTCRDQKRRLIRPYAPALLPIVSFSWLHDRVMEMIRDKPATQAPDSPPRPPAALMALPLLAGERPAAAPAPPREWRPPPPPPGRTGRGRGGRRLRRPAMFGAAAILPFVLALFITRMAAGGDPPGPALAAMPTIAYVTGTSVVTRQGTAPPRTLAAAPAGSLIWQLFWSPDRRWLAWFSGPAQDPFSQVNVTDATTGATRAWPCAGCSTAAFQNDRLLVNTSSVASGVAAFPGGGGDPTPVTVLPAGINDVGSVLLGTAENGTVVYVGSKFGSAPELFAYDAAGQGRLVGQLSFNAVPGGARNPGGLGEAGTSPDGTLLAYGGSILGGDAGTGGLSDSVTVVDLRSLGYFTVDLPAGSPRNLRISGVWIDSSDTVYAAAWPQPAYYTSGTGARPTVTLTPRVYRLQGKQWIDTGTIEASGSGGQDGWIAAIAGNGSMTSTSPSWKGNLVVTAGHTRVNLATGVTAFAWAPAGSASPRPPASSSSPPGEVQR
jgi:DNA-directed RNA polymerase specialized sigma24 family protein